MAYLHGIPAWLGAWVYASVVCQWVDVQAKARFAKGSFVHEYLAFGLCAPLVLLPFAIDPKLAGWRGFVAMATWFYTFRASQMFLEKRFRRETLQFRALGTGATFHDLELCKKDMPKSAQEAVTQESGKGLAMNTVGIVAVVVGMNLRHVLPRWLSVAVGCFLGGVYATLSLNAFGCVLELMNAPVGLKLPPLMKNPLFSESLREFWGVRWDTVRCKMIYCCATVPLHSSSGQDGILTLQSACFHL